MTLKTKTKSPHRPAFRPELLLVQRLEEVEERALQLVMAPGSRLAGVRGSNPHPLLREWIVLAFDERLFWLPGVAGVGVLVVGHRQSEGQRERVS